MQKMPHIQLDTSVNATAAILPGDPARADAVAAFMEDVKEEAFNREYEISNGCGAAIMFRKADFEKCGGFDERFFMYYEDTDLSFRMKQAGGRIMYYPGAVVRHIHAGSSGEWSPFFTYHVCKNKLLFVAKNYGRRRFLSFFARQLKDGLRERNRSKVKGTLVALRMVAADTVARQKDN